MVNILILIQYVLGEDAEGPSHSGAELHGFLSYLVKCCLKGKLYKVYGYKGKQVRDNIHSSDLVNMIWEFIKKPSRGEVYNVGGV